MRRLIFALLLCAYFSEAQIAPEEKLARIEGRVQTMQGDPIRNATLKLQSGGASYAQTSASDGSFVFDKVSPGRYTVTAEHDGFVIQKYGGGLDLSLYCLTVGVPIGDAFAEQQKCVAGAPGTTIELQPGQDLKDLVMKLTRMGAIAGRITDEDGAPVGGLLVQALQAFYEHGARRVWGIHIGTTDADGNYLIPDLAPGPYSVSARVGGFPPANNPRGTARQEAYVTTYYPGEVDPSRAGGVDVTPGAETRGIDLSFRKIRVYSIRGSIGAKDSLPPSQTVILSPTNPMIPLETNEVTTTVGAKDGAFEFRNLPPGTYMLHAVGALFGQQEITLASSDVDGVKLSLSPAIEISGSVTLDGAPGPRPGIKMALIGIPARGVPTSLASYDAENHFTIPRMAPSRYRVTVVGLPQGTYVKSIRFGNQDVMRAPLDLTGGGTGMLEILLSSKAAEVAGVVKNSASGVVAGVAVTLWPKNPDASSTGGLRSATTDEKGRYQISGLAPGDYFVAAWEKSRPGLLQDSGFPAHFASEASQVSVGERARETADVALISRDRIKAEIAKLP